MDVKKIQWIEDRILVLPDAAKETFEGSRLLKPDTVKEKEKACRGVVVAVGPGRVNPDTKIFVNQSLKTGQRVLFGHYAGIDFEEAGVKYKVMRPDDVFGVLPEQRSLVYFIQRESGGPIKIGYTSSKSAKGRMATLQTAHSEKLLLLGTTMHHKEADLHKRFADLRLHGEWFKSSALLVAWIQRNALLTEDGHRQLARARTWSGESR